MLQTKPITECPGHKFVPNSGLNKKCFLCGVTICSNPKPDDSILCTLTEGHLGPHENHNHPEKEQW
jgi:hypothetical protein